VSARPLSLQDAIAWARRWQAEYELAPSDTVRAQMALYYRVLADAAERAQRLEEAAAAYRDAMAAWDCIEDRCEAHRRLLATKDALFALLPPCAEAQPEAMAASVAGPPPLSLSPWPKDLGEAARRQRDGYPYASLDWWGLGGFVVWTATRADLMSSISGTTSSVGDVAGTMRAAAAACDDALVQLGWPREEVFP
jgi:hypothetical protein